MILPPTYIYTVEGVGGFTLGSIALIRRPRALAVVHLVTLGWITASILGALYMIVPMALGTAAFPSPLTTLEG